MKTDYKVGMVAGLGVVMILAVGWVLLRGRPAPQAGHAQGLNPAVRGQEPNRPATMYAATGSQPYTAAPVTTGTGSLMAHPGIPAEANALSGPQPAETGSAANPGLGASAPQVQASTPAVQPVKPARTHVVRDGESLSDISDHYYGTPDKWVKIHRANRSTIKDPDRIYAGMKLVIPD